MDNDPTKSSDFTPQKKQQHGKDTAFLFDGKINNNNNNNNNENATNTNYLWLAGRQVEVD